MQQLPSSAARPAAIGTWRMPSLEAEASPARGYGLALHARLGSSRLIQCQEAVPLREGRRDLEEFYWGAQAPTSCGSGPGAGGSLGSLDPHPQSCLLARASSCFCHSALGAWKGGDNHQCHLLTSGRQRALAEHATYNFWRSYNNGANLVFHHCALG